MIKALARLVNHDGIISATEDPARGTYAGDLPFNQQSRTVTFEVRADLYDDAHMPQGVNNRLSGSP